MSAHSLPINLDKALRNGFFNVDDPKTGGTIAWSNKGKAICAVTTLAAESRALHAASNYGIGTELIVFLKTNGGALTVTGAQSTIVIRNAGDAVRFMVVDNNGTRAWRLVDSSVVIDNVNISAATRASEVMTVSTAADTATLTAAQLLTKVIEGTPTGAATYTLPTAALMVAAIAGAKVGDGFWFVIDNKSAGANTITVAAGGAALRGTLTIAQNTTRSFVLYLTNVGSGTEAYSVKGI